MTREEYFGDWLKVIDEEMLSELMNKLHAVYRTSQCNPEFKNIFRAFRVTPYSKLCGVIVGMSPYPQKGVATGVAFANRRGTPMSPSLKVLKNAVVDLEIPHNSIIFDETLESWCEQGILLLNSALTCVVGCPSSHVLLWKVFIGELIKRIDAVNPGVVWLLLGQQAETFHYFIKNGIVISAEHPASIARKNSRMDPQIFRQFSEEIQKGFGRTIKLFEEYGTCEECTEG